MDIHLNNKNGEIHKVSFGDNQYYFRIDFEYDDDMMREVKQLPGRKWNKEELFWAAPSRSEKEVLEFARENRFFLTFGEGNDFENNPHLAVPEVEEVPNGITFCEGRIARKLDSIRKTPFYWCHNKPCFELAETSHTCQNWRELRHFSGFLSNSRT